MPVSKNKEINMLIVELAIAVLDEPFFLFAKEFRYGCELPARPRKVLHEPDARIRMQACKQPLACLTAEDPFDELVSVISRAQAVAMADTEYPAVDFTDYRLPVNCDPELITEVAKHPHIMITREDIHLNAAVSNFRQLAEQPGEAFGYNSPVFKPIVKQVAQQVYLPGIPGDPVEPSNNMPLAFTA